MLKKRKATELLVIHCSATRPSQNVGVTEIDAWHRQRGFECIGYHYVICRDGSEEIGRPKEMIGAHVDNHNSNSIAICLVGGVNEEDFRKPENNFSPAQFKTLSERVRKLLVDYPTIKSIVGHCELNPNKACPSFDVQAWKKKVKL